MALPSASQLDAGSGQYRLPSSTHVGRVRLAVSNLERSVGFYRDGIGLALLEREGSHARLGAHGSEQVLLELEQQPGVRPIAAQSRLGLYHTAFLLPSRGDLSSFVRHLRKRGIGFGAADHLVSEALYLVDPDGLEVEVYADRPRDQWPRQGQALRMGTAPLRFHTLPPVANDSWQGAPRGTSVGHVHFYVGDLRAAERFYCAGLGLDVMVEFPSALFTSAGGYHHHVGLNAWAAGSPVASERDARLLSWELVLPDWEEVRRAVENLRWAGIGSPEPVHADGAPTFSDPWGITTELVAGSRSVAATPPR